MWLRGYAGEAQNYSHTVIGRTPVVSSQLPLLKKVKKRKETKRD